MFFFFGMTNSSTTFHLKLIVAWDFPERYVKIV